MQITKEFSVVVVFTDRDSCGNPQNLSAGDVGRAIEKTGVENLEVSVHTSKNETQDGGVS